MVQVGWELLSFVLKIFIVLGGVGVLVALVAGKRRGGEGGALKLEHLNRKLSRLREQVANVGLGKKASKRASKDSRKARKKQDQAGVADRPRVFVLEFKGDIRANAVEALRREITAIVQGAREGDEVLLKLSSPGGAVSGYGLAASQLSRLRDKDVKLTVAVDQVAASGGYLMAAVADEIIAAPFAMVGSIGVVAMVPNLRRFLGRYDVDVEQLTAGEHKRTLSVFGENTAEGREQFQRDLESIHQQFKAHVSAQRPQLDIEQVATGGHWTAANALELGLVDRLETSDEWLLNREAKAELYSVRWVAERSIGDRVGGRASALLRTLVDSALSQRPLL